MRHILTLLIEHRLSLVEAPDVMQEEVEDTVLDVAATSRNVRRGLSVWRLGRHALRRARARKGRPS